MIPSRLWSRDLVLYISPKLLTIPWFSLYQLVFRIIPWRLLGKVFVAGNTDRGIMSLRIGAL
jgi:hypothetical protein